jgi:putative membrane protein
MSPTTTFPGRASRRHKQLLAGTALAAAATLALAGPIASALAASDGTPVVATSETVKANLNADGSLDVARLFSQIQATGNGHVSLEDPTSTKGLRNLDGWGSPSTSDGKASYDFSVDGTKQFRTVADFTKDLPVSVHIAYRLDGTKVDPGDLDGKSGKLAVSYTVKNTTADATPIVYQDGHGKTVTETAQVVTPYVGQLALDLPDSFRDISSVGDRADQAGDGHGGRLVTWTMVLFEPIGQNTQRFGFTAQVDHLALPTAHMQIVPVSPENHPELKFGQDGFQSGAATGQQLTDGATQIDDNVLKLRDGAAQVLDGLTQLQAGAQQLNGGLAAGVPQAIAGGKKLAKGANDAADGATQVADGAHQVAVGNAKLAAGLGDLSDGSVLLQTGARQLNSGAAQLSTAFEDPESENDLIDGSQALAGALGLISGGLAQLNDGSSGLPAAKAGLIAVKAAIDTLIIPGIGTTSSPCDPADTTKQSLLGCLQPILAGVTQLGTSTTAGLPAAQGGVAAVQKGLNGDPASPDPAVQAGVKGGVTKVQGGLADALKPGGGLDTLAATIKGSGDCGATCQSYVDLLLNGATAPPSPPFPPGTTSLRQQVSAANNGLLQVLAGIGASNDLSSLTLNGGLNQVAGGLVQIVTKVNGELLPGLQQLQGGLLKLRAGLTNADFNGGTSNPQCNASLTPPATGYCGVTEGLAQLVAGVTSAVSGIGQLAPGAAAANTGAGDLADGIAQAGDGAVQLADGASQLSGGIDQLAGQAPTAVSGAQQLAAGSSDLSKGSTKLAKGLNGKLAPGAEQLSAGLGDLNDAVTGSGQIADGLGQAHDGQSQIVDGAGQLSEQGTSQLVKSGNDTASSYGREYAIMKALDHKGATQGMPYGSPKGSSDNRGAYDITIAAVGSQHTMGNTGRGVVGLVVLGLGALGATLIRGRFA